jgi:serine/threonine-protein kinase
MWQAGEGEEDAWYRLGRTLEAGVTGEVFEAEHPRLPAPCAVKILRAALTERIEALPQFRHDVETVAALRHPNVLQVMEVGSTPEVPAFVVSELLDGRTLADRLGVKGRIPLLQAVEIVRAAAAGLQAAHHAGVVHGELNPRNILLARSEGHDRVTVKLLDFGIVRLRALDTIATLPVETIRYLSPEQASGRSEELDGRADQFALAVIAYRMLSGRDAFEGDSAVSLLYQIVHGQPNPSPIGAGGAAVEAVLRRALAKDRRHRYESIGEFAQALAEAAGEQHRPTPPPQVVVVQPPAPVVVAPAPRPAPGPPLATDDGSDLFTHPFFEPPGMEPRPRRRRRVRIIYRRRRSSGGLTMLLVLGIAVSWLGGALAVGWRPPLAWRQSPLWHQLGLPYAER